ncbi:MAG: PSD1 domain-containing protein [Verrucomicrobia bacterium]|nr:PSD1 domain-containing protein [Verrucomicrobiota bacterium]
MTALRGLMFGAWCFFGVWMLALGCLTAAAEPSKTQLDFFESKVRPIFTENCYKCHSPGRGKVKAGLELDWKGGWEKGGDSGPAIIPGEPEKSLLIKAVRYTDPDLKMPPKGDKLSAAQVNDLVAWVKMGAPDPRATRPAAEKIEYAGDSKDHWAFKPVKKPAPPTVKNEAWVKNDIDRFILAKLEEKGMKPNEPAEKHTLIRRVYYDLIGLPPTPEEVSAFENDSSSDAYEKVVDHLLVSPHYGERWARHWLDVARYSDSKGQFDRRRESSIYPYAWTYRDYVIKAFNDDKPYDRFIIEQLAADKLSLSSDKSALAALGFLTLGDHFNGNQSDIINDRIDVTSKAFLGLTVSCARCHDHKFDPIPQADYYSLHGIFASSQEPPLRPEIGDPKANPNYEDYLVKRRELDTRIQTARAENMNTVFGDYKRLGGVYLYATQMPVKERAAYLAKTGADADVLKNWQQVTRGGGRQAASVFGIWNALARIPEGNFAAQAPRLIANLERSERARELNPYVLQAFKAKPPHTLAEAAAIYGALFVKNDPAWQNTLAILLNDAMFRFLSNRQRGQFFALREQSDMLEMVHPGTPARAPALVDGPAPKDSPIFIRGELENPGNIVPRRFLEVLSGTSRPTFKNGSGRLELAQAIANKNNPLTARVMVNRVWQHHFGEGFVTTPDDFGNQSTPPSHPELVDYLASRFMDDGWSLKKLHKSILLSATYQQSTKNNPTYAEKDPFNRLLWRANVRRLEFEPLRDSILYLGGELDLTVGGHPVDLSEGTHKSQRRGPAMNRPGAFQLPTAPRRSIYGYIDRADLLEALNTFDFANPLSSMGKRYETTVPQQALFLMNSPLVIEQVRRVVNRDEFQKQKTAEGRVRFLYELFFQRPPTPEEIRFGVEFVSAPQPEEKSDLRFPEFQTVANVVGQVNKPRRPNQAKPSPVRQTPKTLNRWQEYAHALLLSNEASFVN